MPVPIRVQGKMVAVNQMFVTAMIALVEKYGQDGKLILSHRDVINLVGEHQNLEVTYDFENDAVQLRIR